MQCPGSTKISGHTREDGADDRGNGGVPYLIDRFLTDIMASSISPCQAFHPRSCPHLDCFDLYVTVVTKTCNQPMEKQETSANQSWRMSAHPSKRRSPAEYLERSYQYYSSWLHHTIKFSFSLSTGAGGFSITPALHLHPVVEFDSWLSIDVLRLIRPGPKFGLVFRGSVEDVISDFQEAFSAGKLAPSVLLDSQGTSISIVDVRLCIQSNSDRITDLYRNFLLYQIGGTLRYARSLGF